MASERILVSSGTQWEEWAGYSRAVRVGNFIEVAGTVAVDEKGQVVGQDDVVAQTKFVFQKIENALIQAGASLEDVVRTRMYVRDISKWEDVAKVHGEVFKEIRPACTLLASNMISPEFLIEIEASAIVTDVN